ncbi:GGDEF domain-containing protein [Roseibium polysiphoniae]|uniref:GGDEF domain-containing protein n=1 Tax=Roseibium polysiphoniae TaxID=2571221 RepID=A0A944GST6_9HYPH|nr:GGDEF domain-containing protein [Roseibium polysiphoniae]MBS8259810.1 GGDEF domain-containing protein [Roseibium polysiphoniae]
MSVVIRENILRHGLSAAAVVGAMLFVALLLAAAVEDLLQSKITTSVRANAQAHAFNWTDRFLSTTPSATSMIAEGAASEEDIRRISDPILLGGILHLQLFNKDGVPTFVTGNSDFDPSRAQTESALKVLEHKTPIVELFHMDHAELEELAELPEIANLDAHDAHDAHEAHGDHDGHESEEIPHAVAQAFLPAYSPSGELQGVIQVNVDVSHLMESLEMTFHQVGQYLIFGTLLIVLVPVAAFSFRAWQVMRANRQQMELNRFDRLTGILNRNAITDVLDTHFGPGKDPAGLGILFIDVDNFKQVNDRFGHQCGDQVLKHTAAALKANLPGDGHVVGRYGGDEFLVLCPQATMDDLRAVYSQMRASVRQPIDCHGTAFVTSLSIGAYVAQSEDTKRCALHAADLAVYEAKRRGRDQAVEYEPELGEKATHFSAASAVIASAPPLANVPNRGR